MVTEPVSTPDVTFALLVHQRTMPTRVRLTCKCASSSDLHDGAPRAPRRHRVDRHHLAGSHAGAAPLRARRRAGRAGRATTDRASSQARRALRLATGANTLDGRADRESAASSSPGESRLAG